MSWEDSLAYGFVTTNLYNAGREKFLPTRVYDKAKDYVETVNALIDRDTRAATVFKVSLSALSAIGSKVLGSSIENHPYFALHKAHLQALSTALDAQSTYTNAMEAMDRAARAADGSEAIAMQSRQLLSTMFHLRVEFGFKGGFVPEGEGADNAMPAVLPWIRMIASKLNRGASVANAMLLTMDWQARVCRVYMDGLKLLAMARVEWQVAKRGGELFQQKVKSLVNSSSQISVVVGKVAERDQQWAQYDREAAQIARKSTGSPQAIADPGRFAEGNVREVEAVVRKLGAICDIAMSNTAVETKGDKMAQVSLR